MGSLKANKMLLFNKKITAVEACKLGLVTQVFQDANFQSEVWPKIKEWSELPINVRGLLKYFIKLTIINFTSLSFTVVSLQQAIESPV
jgi:peroxisomal 3,2-trans-enoyl-CoA isomerase